MITVNSKSFQNAVKRAMRFSCPKSSLPVLHGARIAINKHEGWIATTTLEIFYKTYFEVSSDEEFDVVVADLKALQKLIASFDKNIEISKISIETENNGNKETTNKVVFKSGNKSVSQTYFLPEEYPNWMEVKNKQWEFVVDMSVFNQLYNKISKSQYEDDDRPAMMGFKQSTGKLFATNGFVASTIPNYTLDMPEIFFPKNFADNFDLFEKSTATILSYGEETDKNETNHYISLKNSTDEMTVWYNFSQKFPDFGFLHDLDKSDKEFDIYTISKKQLLDNLKFLKITGTQIKMRDGKMESSSVEDNSDLSCDVDQDGSFSIKWSFNCTLMMRLMDQFDSDNIEFKVWSNRSPIKLASDNFEDGVAFLMPMLEDEE